MFCNNVNFFCLFRSALNFTSNASTILAGSKADLPTYISTTQPLLSAIGSSLTATNSFVWNSTIERYLDVKLFLEGNYN